MYSNLQPYVIDRKPPLGAVRNPYLPINQGLILDAMMNEGAGNKVYDLSGNGNDLTLQGNAGWSIGPNGYVYASAGAVGDCAISGASSSLIVNQGTIIIKFRATANTNYDYAYHLYLDTNNHIYMIAAVHVSTQLDIVNRSGGANITSLCHVYTIDDGSWYTYAHTWNSSIAVMYQNGVPVDTESGNEVLAWSGSPKLYIGGSQTSEYQWPGEIDYVYVYNRALTASEIQQLYREPFCGYRWTSIIELASYAAAAEGSSVAKIMQQMNQFNGGAAA